MELRHLQYFLALAEELNFSRAADRLHIAQPSLSQQIRQLERELDADLFDRSVRPIQLTSAGELLMTDAYGLVADLEATAREVRRAGRGEVGRLRIGYSYGGSYDLVLSLLRRLRKTWPDANVFVHQLPQQEQVPALIAGRVDLVLGRLIEVLPSDIVVQPLRDEHLIAILPVSHPQATGPTADLAALGEEPFVMFPRRMEPIVFDNYAQACLGAGFTLHVEHEVTDAQTQALAIAAGLGIGLSGDHLALRFPELAYVPVAPEFVIARIVALWVDRRVPPALREFMASF